MRAWKISAIAASCLPVVSAMVGASLAQATESKVGAQFNLNHEHVPGQLIVKFKQQGAVSTSAVQAHMMAQEFKAKHLKSFRASGASLWTFEHLASPAGVGLSAKQASEELLAIAKQLVKRPDVAYVEANTIMRTQLQAGQTLPSVVPNDPSLDRLYGLHNEGQSGGTPDADIDAPEAWVYQKGSRDVIVAVIDTGIDDRHEDLVDNMWRNPGETGLDRYGRDKRSNGVDDDGNGYVDDWRGWDFANDDNNPFDDNGHGTHCAGTIGASGDNDIGVVGVAWKASLVGIKFLTGTGSGSLDDAISSIEYATNIGVHFTSNSWGGGGYSATLEAAIQEANDNDQLFIAAAGNAGVDTDVTANYPSGYEIDNILSVAATDRNDGYPSFTNYGLETVDVAAPGHDIYSTSPGNRYVSLSGTSMATPHVAGLAALIYSSYPKFSSQDVKKRILGAVDRTVATAATTVSGGRINALNALEPDTIDPGEVEGFEVVKTGISSLELRWRVAGDDGAEGEASRYELRLSDEPVTSEDDWQSATPLRVTSQVDASIPQVLTGKVLGLPFNSRGYLVIRAFDNVGNASPVSESLSFQTHPVRYVAEYLGSDLSGVTAESPWGLEDVEGVGSVYSDSPGKSYENLANSSLRLDALEVGLGEVMLQVKHSYDFELDYDYGHIEVATKPGGPWKEVAKLTGLAGWQANTYVLSDLLTDAVRSSGGQRSVWIRFRVTSDGSVVRNGWFIDSIRVVEPQN